MQEAGMQCRRVQRRRFDSFVGVRVSLYMISNGISENTQFRRRGDVGLSHLSATCQINHTSRQPHEHRPPVANLGSPSLKLGNPGRRRPGGKMKQPCEEKLRGREKGGVGIGKGGFEKDRSADLGFRFHGLGGCRSGEVEIGDLDPAYCIYPFFIFFLVVSLFPSPVAVASCFVHDAERKLTRIVLKHFSAEQPGCYSNGTSVRGKKPNIQSSEFNSSRRSLLSCHASNPTK
ncbi:hypothetical protein H6P81_019363 [Aristolochia fimbriata]|uniref:Uncharacterized protein n=1 Tax=Aristolochia fimbriata TaxID=158543 RepID=A0AAV7DSH3_ARIFI|nr:hypothetical protein H6P81_019363 [Aristolochia fimbriata]